MSALCIYRDDDDDALLAVWAVRKALGPEVEFVAAKPGDDPIGITDIIMPNGRIEYTRPWFADCDLLILGHICLLEVLRAMAREARSVLVIISKTIQEDLKDILFPRDKYNFRFHDWIESGGYINGNLAAILDPSRSTAGLTWDYLHGNNNSVTFSSSASMGAARNNLAGKSGSSSSLVNPRPRIIDLIEDWSLGRFKYGDETRAFAAVLASYDWTDLPTMFNYLDDWCDLEQEGNHIGMNRWNIALTQGMAILRAQAQATRSILATRGTIKIAGHIVPCANVPPSMASEVGQELYAVDHTGDYVAPFAATYHDDLAAGRRRFTLHSPEGGADVREIARQVMAYQDGPHDHGNRWFGCMAFGTARSATFDAPLGWMGE